MSEAPERIWAWWDDEYDVGVVIKHGAKGYVPDTCKEYGYVPDTCKEYVRANRIEELEAKLAKAVGALVLVECPFQWGTRSYYNWQWRHHCAILAALKGEIDE